MSTQPQIRTWGAGVRTLRGYAGMSQIELAKKSGCTQATISRLETGSLKLSDGARVRIARALGADPHKLFPYEDDDVA